MSKIDFNKLQTLHDLAAKAQVSYVMNYCDGPNDFYFEILSCAKSEQWLGRNHSFDIAVECVIEFLLTIQPKV